MRIEKLQDLLNEDGEPVDRAYIDYVPQPLLPTYSYVFKGKELRYSLRKNRKEDADRWPYVLEKISV